MTTDEAKVLVQLKYLPLRNENDLQRLSTKALLRAYGSVFGTYAATELSTEFSERDEQLRLSIIKQIVLSLARSPTYTETTMNVALYSAVFFGEDLE